MSKPVKRIFAFQCTFCLEKFDIGPQLEDRLLNHYYKNHENEEEVEDKTIVYDSKTELNRKYTENLIAFLDEQVKKAENLLVSTSKSKPSSNEKDDEKLDLEQSDEFLCNTETVFESLGSYSNKNVNDQQKTKISRVKDFEKNKDHHGEYPCQICNRVYKYKGSLVYHQRYHNDPKYICKICKKKFYFEFILRNHLKDRHSVLDVDECQKSMLILDQKTKKIQCEVCYKLLKSKLSLRIHMKMHSNDPLATCKICETTFKNPNSCRQHVKKIHRIENVDDWYKNTLINGKPSQKSELARNIERFNRYPEHYRKFKCRYCEKGFTHMSARCVHEKMHRAPTLKCKICLKDFWSFWPIKKHIRITHGIDEKSQVYKNILENGEPVSAIERKIT